MDTSIDQIENMKLLHVRFHFNDQAAENDEENPLLMRSSDRVTGCTPAKKVRKTDKHRVRNFGET